MKYDFLIVGAGFAGCVIAERLASQLDKSVLLIDRRTHFGGNAYDSYDDHGILIHNYGPHLFHTNDPHVFSYLSQFTSWRLYEHRVLACVGDTLYPIPINRTTLNQYYGIDLKNEDETRVFLDAIRLNSRSVTNSEDIIVSQVGKELFEKFFRGYTKKQWRKEPKELWPGVCGRIPVRVNTDDRYFTDRYQYIPENGYCEMFRSMLSHPKIEFAPNTDFKDIRDTASFDRLIYTGPIDEYFDYMFGRLPYRSIRFIHETTTEDYIQQVAQINYCDENIPYTRSCEWKHITGQQCGKTTITREYPETDGEEYYPVPTEENHSLYNRYKAEADKVKNAYFAGRLAEYRYYNMDQVVARTLKMFSSIASGKPHL